MPNTRKLAIIRQFAREPVQIKPARLDVMSQLGIDTESPGIETAKRLSPRMIDAGKCFGASHAFIRDSLDQEVPLIATKYEGGVPLEGVLTQEIHTRHWEESSETGMQTELEWGISTILEETSYNPDTYSHLTEEQQDILRDVHQLASRRLAYS